MKRILVPALAAFALAACLDDDPIGPQCQPTTLSTTATLGDTVVLNTGLRYVTLEEGTGTTVAFCDAVRVGYSGSFTDGTVFDPGTRPLESLLGYGRLIPGFEQGVVGMQVGGRRRLIVPPQLAYGAEDVIDEQTREVLIPGNSTLFFDVELLAHAPVDD